MERQVWICTECSKAILPEDTFILHTDWAVSPGLPTAPMLSAPRNASCSSTTAGSMQSPSEQCAKGYRMSELGSDPVGAMDPLCPRCRKDLIGSVRAHLYNCSMLPLAILQAARNAREVAQRLVERGRELSDTPGDLMRELEAALRVLREAGVQATRGRSGA